MKYTILTKESVRNTENHEAIFAEQESIIDFNKEYDVVFDDGRVESGSLNEMFDALDIKEGVDLVRFEDGNRGFVAYYGRESGWFKIAEKGRMTRKEFDSIKEGDFVDDLYNGICRVNYTYEEDGERFFECTYVEWSPFEKAWIESGDSREVSEADAITSDRWCLYTEEDITVLEISEYLEYFDELYIGCVDNLAFHGIIDFDVDEEHEFDIKYYRDQTYGMDIAQKVRDNKDCIDLAWIDADFMKVVER